MECRCAAGHLEGVDVRLDEHRRLVEVGARVEVRDRREPDVSSFERAADALESEQFGLRLGPALEDLRQFVVPVEPVERDLRH